MSKIVITGTFAGIKYNSKHSQSKDNEGHPIPPTPTNTLENMSIHLADVSVNVPEDAASRMIIGKKITITIEDSFDKC